MTQEEKAAEFRRMHLEPPLLVLCNAWDPVSAALIGRLQWTRAIATSSAVVAWSLGYPDGERIPHDEMIEVVRRVVGAVPELPVTADLEAGYGDPGATARAAWQAGAVGLNLEDASNERDLFPVDEAAAHVRAVREAAPEIVINARTDVYLAGLDDFDEAVMRANTYLAAGADCAFIPAVTDPGLIGRLVQAVDGPVSMLAFANSPSIVQLEQLGVARVSLGSGTGKIALAAAVRAVETILDTGSFAVLAEALRGDDLNALLG
jgi:2-methylisocitrate lyase-like PEP mutase family enzyme